VAFYEKYLELCAKAGKSPSCVALEISLSKTTVNRWKNGGGVTDATALKVANYFGVSPEWLKGETEDPSAGIKKDPIPKDEVVSSAKQKLLDSVDGMSDEQLEKLLGLIEEAKKLL
jgi:transcriptional regulator with XRE-family HTH domain